MTRLRRLYRVHAQAARLIGRAGKNFYVQTHGWVIIWIKRQDDKRFRYNFKSKIEHGMNRPVLLHIVERLENFLGKLPETIQKPILSELTPLKELFLQQRPPRLALTGAAKRSAPELVRIFFGLTEDKPAPNAPMSIFSCPEVPIAARPPSSL